MSDDNFNILLKHLEVSFTQKLSMAISLHTFSWTIGLTCMFLYSDEFLFYKTLWVSYK